MAIILPLLLFCVFGIAHLGMYYLARQAALSVAQVAVDGERGWQVEPGAGQQRAEQFLDQLPAVLEQPQVAVSNDGEHVTATVTARTVTVIPWLDHTVSQSASAPVERLT